MADPRSGLHADGEAAAGFMPTWTWHDQQGHGQPDAHASHASGEHGTPRTVHDDWASTSGFSSQRANSAHSAHSASWTTESTRARTPTDSSWDHHEDHHGRIHEQFQNDQRRPTRQEVEEARFRRLYKARTCRICLEVVEPTFDFDQEDAHAHEYEQGGPGAGVDGPGGVGAAVAGMGSQVLDKITAMLPPSLQPAAIGASFASMTSRKPRVQYISEDADDGRLISPCHCKGSQKYVHEGCVQRWRLARPLADRNFWRCPTCGFEYRIQRLRWSRLVSNRFTRASLTVMVFLLTLFILGFVADPLMDLWSDPAGTIMDSLSDYDDDLPILSGVWDKFSGGGTPHAGLQDELDLDLESTWYGHFLKGLFSLGFVGVIKTFFMLSPFSWWNLRGVGLTRGRRRTVGGRDRFDNVGWVFIVIGVFTFLGASWKGIDYLCGRLLDSASNSIADIGGGGPDVDEDEDVRDGHLHTE